MREGSGGSTTWEGFGCVFCVAVKPLVEVFFCAFRVVIRVGRILLVAGSGEGDWRGGWSSSCALGDTDSVSSLPLVAGLFRLVSVITGKLPKPFPFPFPFTAEKVGTLSTGFGCCDAIPC